MIFPIDDRLPKSFALAKRLAIIAIGMTPLLLVVAVFKQSASNIVLGVLSLLVVPIMAGVGYGSCRLARLISLLEREDTRTFFPRDWPLPFRLFNAIHDWKYHPLHVAATSAIINIFVVLWCGFLLIWVSTGIVLMTIQS